MDKPTHLTALGKVSTQPQHPDDAILEAVGYNAPDKMMPAPVVRYTCPEFTSLCPVTGQPDFAHFVIDYIPNQLLVESKALKLFMCSFRNHQAFHETTTMIVATRFRDACKPIWLRVAGIWFPRGGIPIDIFFQTGHPPKEAYVPEIDLKHFRGR